MARDENAREGGARDTAGDGVENPLDQNAVEQAYARWAPVYDVVFGAVFAHGRAAAIKAAERLGGRILEVGVGTGISLPDYSRKNRLVGVDICEPMLRKAKERVEAQHLSHVEMLALMDGTRLAFADASFDVVVAQFVITTVPDPEATLDEFARVVRPGGEIVLVNHFATEAGPLRTLERGFAPLARKLGWRPEFPFRRLTEWSKRAGLPLLERRQTPPLGLFSLLRFAKAAA
jgi:phosphatidylethanolamine/phosphatidyl-N-methylethanolamine N-methyltransferase